MPASVKERPILFSDPMVRAILAGQKTMTRRIAKTDQFGNIKLRAGWWIDPSSEQLDQVPADRMPYAVGQRLWVRECWKITSNPEAPYSGLQIMYGAGHATRYLEFHEYQLANRYVSESAPWRPSIHMPRWASRITLEITGVRIERLQSITEEDARAEGVGEGYVPCPHPTYPDIQTTRCVGYRPMFARLWREINGPESWDQNPWVWVISFRKDERHEQAE